MILWNVEKNDWRNTQYRTAHCQQVQDCKLQHPYDGLKPLASLGGDKDLQLT